MDLCGAVAAMRFSGRHCVTAAMDNVDFVGRIDLTEVAVIEGYVFDVGTSSLDARVEVRAENPRIGETRTITTSFFTYVALDEDGEPIGVLGLKCPTGNQTDLRDRVREERVRQLRKVAETIEN